MNNNMWKVIYLDFKKYILPKLLITLGALSIGFIITHFTGLRYNMPPRIAVDLILGPLFGGIVIGLSYIIYMVTKSYLKNVKRRAVRMQQEEPEPSPVIRAEVREERRNFEF